MLGTQRRRCSSCPWETVRGGWQILALPHGLLVLCSKVLLEHRVLYFTSKILYWFTKWLIFDWKGSSKRKIPTEEVTCFEVGLRGERGKHCRERERPEQKKRKRQQKSTVWRMSRGRKKWIGVLDWLIPGPWCLCCVLPAALLVNKQNRRKTLHT